MKLYLISGDGIGAGKTTLAGILGMRFSIATSLREHCVDKFGDRWFFETAQAAKARIFRGTMTYRDVLIDESERLKVTFGKDIWVKKTVEKLMGYRYMDCCVDDVRFEFELDYLREHLSKHFEIVHVHVCNENAKKEPHCDNEALKKKADYLYAYLLSPNVN